MPSFAHTAQHLRLPMYAFHGDADGLTDADGSRMLYKAWGGTDKTLRVWPDSFHEVLNDADGEPAAAELLAWLVAQRDKV